MLPEVGGEEVMGSYSLMDVEFLFEKIKFWKQVVANGYTTMWMYMLGGVLNHCGDLPGLPGLSLVYMGVYICYQTCLFLIKWKTNKNIGVYNVSEL